MKKALKFTAFSKWLKTYPGQYYLRYEQEQLDAVLPKFYGYYLVQAGVINSYDLKSASTINHRVYAGRITYRPSLDLLIESNLEELPFQGESVDVFFLPHTLEFCQHPQKLLDEIYHTLIPGGKVIILGFNPYSFIGLTKLIKSNKKTQWIGALRSFAEVRGCLLSSGFTLDFHQYFCFRPPLKSDQLLKKLFFLEQLGQCCFQTLGGVYMIIAQKKSIPFSPVKLNKFKNKIPVAHGFPEPSTNKGGL